MPNGTFTVSEISFKDSRINNSLFLLGNSKPSIKWLWSRQEASKHYNGAVSLGINKEVPISNSFCFIEDFSWLLAQRSRVRVELWSFQKAKDREVPSRWSHTSSDLEGTGTVKSKPKFMQFLWFLILFHAHCSCQGICHCLCLEWCCAAWRY